jgi:uncharacterized membrane protein
MIPNNKSNRPRIKVKLTMFDWVSEIVAFAFLIVLIALPIIYYNDLPESIPSHFNAAGQPDDFSSKSSLWFLPITSVFMYLLMTVIEAFPHIYNFPVEITPENALTQYRIATRLIRILKTVIIVIFSFISFQTIKTATGGATGLGRAFFPVFLLLTFGIIIFYIIQSLNNRYKNSI